MSREVDRIMDMAVKEQKQNGEYDLESLEFHIRGTMHDIGKKLLERILNAESNSKTEKVEKRFRLEGYQEKTVQTVLGKVKIRRAYYYDRKQGEGQYPRDKELDIVGTSFSPGMRRIMGKVGAYQPFMLGQEAIQEMSGVSVTAKEIERISEEIGQKAEEFLREEKSREQSNKNVKPINVMYISIDGTGVPMVKAETENRLGKGEDGKAKTREAKLGCIFTQTGVDKDGYAVRDENSTTYVGAIETAEEFGERIYCEAIHRGIERATKICMLGDAAAWIWNIAQGQFPGAIQIVDQYHAREHYWSVAKVFFGKDEKKRQWWAEKLRIELDDGKVEKVIESIKQLVPSTDEQRDVCKREIGYYENNKHRMRYDQYRREGLFVGSGVIEAGCRTLVGQRLKQSGMHWSLRGANSIIALRCCISSHLWEDFWEYRAAA